MDTALQSADICDKQRQVVLCPIATEDTLDMPMPMPQMPDMPSSKGTALGAKGPTFLELAVYTASKSKSADRARNLKGQTDSFIRARQAGEARNIWNQATSMY